MNLNRLLLPLGLLSGLLTSCIYPYPPNPNGPIMATSPEFQDQGDSIESERQKRFREAQEQARRDEEGFSNIDPVGPRDPSPIPPPKRDYRTAVAIPGKQGFVFNPFTNNPVDVRAIPAGTLVRDPNDPDAEHKFRVP